jgi:RHS repeat-associated protein
VTDAAGLVISEHHYLPFGEEVPPSNHLGVGNLSNNSHRFTGHERDKETGLDYMMARYYEAGLGRFMSPDPLRGHLADPQTLNRYVYAGNNPIRFSDPTGLDFYLKCSGKDKSTCQGGHAGQMVNNKYRKGQHFEATVIHSDKKGNLLDQHGNKYSGRVDSTGVNFTSSVNGKTTTSTGVWKRDSAAVSFTQNSGALKGFSFELDGNPHSGQDARGSFSFGGTQEKAAAALEAAGLREQTEGASRPGADFRSPEENKFNATHFNFDWRRSGSGGNFHTGEINMGIPGHGGAFFRDFFESIDFFPNGGGDE